MSEVDPMKVIADVIRAQREESHRGVSSYVALGDSFTAGTGCEAGQCWADQLAARLQSGSPDLVYRNLAMEGARSEQVIEQVGPALQLEPDLVSVICGINDVLFSVRPDVLAYARNLAAILRRLQTTLPEVVILTATAPERWEFLGLGPRTAARLERGLARLNRATRAVAASHGASCVELAEDSGLADVANFAADGFHPSPAGHDRAALAFTRAVEARCGLAVDGEVSE